MKAIHLVLTFMICFSILFFTKIEAQIEVESDSTVTVGNIFSADAYLKIRSVNKRHGMYLHSTFPNTSGIPEHGFFNKMDITSSSGEYRGIGVDIITDGITPNKKIGVLNKLEGSVNSSSTGTYNWIRNYAKIANGTFNYIASTSVTGTSSFGSYNYLVSNDSALKYGHRNYLTGSAATTFGMDNVVSTTTTNSSFGVFNRVYQQTTNTISGTRNNLITSINGTKPAYGTFNYIFDKNNQTVFGTYNLVIPENTVTGGTKYASYNVITSDGAPDNVFGVYSNINGQPGYAGYFVGPLYTSTGTLSGSDENLKENIFDLKENLDKIMQLKPKIYDLKNEPGKKGIKNQFGFLAQDVQKIFPGIVTQVIQPGKQKKILEHQEYVHELPDGSHIEIPAEHRLVNKLDGVPLLALRYDGFIPVIVGAIQEQQDEINQLKINQESIKEYADRIIELEYELNNAIQALNLAHQKYILLEDYIVSLQKCVDCDKLETKSDKD